jgi:iron complex outermembrane receptor protein
MAHPQHLSLGALAASLLCASFAAAADDTNSVTDTINITGRSDAAPSLAGFGDAPLARSPLQVVSYGAQRLADANVTRIGDLTRLDASVGDAYNAAGYWSIISIRGYTLDNRFNVLRDGLPINAETAIALENKDRIEVLKGVSGIQAGSSAPGGLVNLLVKRPVGRQRSVTLGWEEQGTLGLAMDLGDRAGPDGIFGWRLNAAVQHLDPKVHDTQGHRSLLSLATDWQIGADTLLQAEVESSRQQQPSVAGFSMLGDTVPSARDIDTGVNLNHQPWNKPVVLNGNTASLRLQQRLGDDWRVHAHAMAQRLKSDDRTAFPYGNYTDPDNFVCNPCDRFAPDGSFTYWQYVSDNERRNSDALDLGSSGRLRSGGVEQTLEAGVLLTRYRGRFQDQVFDIAGTGKIDGSLVTPPSNGVPAANTDRSERSTEFYLRDALRFGNRWSLWLGLRHTLLRRESVLTRADDAGSLEETRYSQSVNIPWLAAAWQLTPQTMLYTSWGQGLESDVAPNRPSYTNAGQVLPALKSRQVEAGIKHSSERVDASLAWFDIDRPASADLGACDGSVDSCTHAIDGGECHRGFEAQLALRQGAWDWQASLMLLEARRHGSLQPDVNGNRPVNVPSATLRLGSAYRVAAVPGLELQAALAAEGNRVVLPYDTSVHIPGWTRLDMGARWVQQLAGNTVTWRVGVDNATNRQAWKESPYQFGHVYLYPLAARTWRVSAQTAF